MIHNSSSDPVLIKKISLKIWSLRDEIEARIQQKVDSGEISAESLSDSVEEKIIELRSEYTRKTALPDNVVQLKSGSELPAEGEDDMEKAMAAAMAGTEESESATEDNVVAMNAEAAPSPLPSAEGNIITIGTEPPVSLPDEKVFKGKTILSEISMDKMFFFSNKAFTEGQSIVIQFSIPKTFIMNADVIYCRPFNIKSRIISQNNYTHRMLVKFSFLREGERALLRQFIQSIEPDVTKIVKKAATEESESEEGDFNELDDLGL